MTDYIDVYENYLQAFPDTIFNIDEILTCEDRVAAQVSCKGTHTGILGTKITPTFQQVSVSGCIIWHWQDGKVVEVWEFWDELGFWQQLGFTLTNPQQQ